MSISGSVAAAFWPVARAFERQVGSSGGGAAVCVYYEGRKVVDLWGGVRDEHGRPWREDTMSMSFSTSKGVTSTLLNQLVDRGELDYDDSVARYWPEFAANGKGTISVRDLMTHRAGLSRIRPLIDRGERILDWEYMTDRLAGAEARPTTHSAYHALTYGWLTGGLIQRITRDIEAMRSFYMELFPPSGEVDRVSVLRLCQTKEEYHQYGGPPNSGGYWHPGNEELVLFDYSYTQRTLTPAQKKAMRGRKLTSKDSMLVMRHEAFHQYIFYAIGEFSPHDWFNEGYGDYFSGAVVNTNSGRVRRIQPSPWRVELAKRMAAGGKGSLPLEKILRAERAEFYNRSRVGDYYAGAWSFVYFLKQSKEVQRHERWSTLLGTYFGAVQEAYREQLEKFGVRPTLANKQVASFEARKAALDRTLDGVDLQELERAWRAWVVDMPDK